MDPRNYQIITLSTFILVGVTRLGFQIDWLNALVIISVALLAQRFLFAAGQEKSALISSLSLVLLLRTDLVWLAGFAALLAIVSKRFVRFNGAHLFNPSAFALVMVTGLSSQAYISPGQWGALGLAAFLVLGAGLMVVTRAQRLDVALSFLFTWLGIVFLRGWYLGDPITIAVHQMQSGALLLFAFFMITDPKTTPLDRYARMGFGVSVAVLAAILQFNFYLSAAAIYALVALAPLVTILNLYTRNKTNVKENTIKNHVNYNCIYSAFQRRKRDGILRVLRCQS